MLGLIFLPLIGLAAGWIAGKLTKSGKPGVVGLMLVGVVGAFVGNLLLWLVGFSANGLLAQLITATFGAVLCIHALRKWC